MCVLHADAEMRKCTLRTPVYESSDYSRQLKIKKDNVLDVVDNTTNIASRLECADDYSGSVSAATCTNGYITATHTCQKSE